MSALATEPETEAAPAAAGNWLVYDGDCPFCSRYVQLLRIREAVGPLRLVNARDGGAQAIAGPRLKKSSVKASTSMRAWC